MSISTIAKPLPPKSDSQAKEDPLERELKFFERNRKEFLRLYEGKVVVIKDEEFLGSYPDDAAAFRAGTERYGLETFLIKRVLKNESIAVSPLLSKSADL